MPFDVEIKVSNNAVFPFCAGRIVICPFYLTLAIRDERSRGNPASDAGLSKQRGQYQSKGVRPL
jgi:hypothetical protein